ncbi:MAG: glutamine--tRNA ligase/YqeY domain fusion protein [Calditrichaceae bacterium]|nr:glutamine--tRNA ligase/YqeY domain fusion protein [Calditrichaceae bacterium]MBN2708481.1 glutamine--tRNA ligase/YqeY domain fusion protein [Calditrichaceae bacterium]RQV91952.1 MAG: glutamine--tRNA ligase/YqeY domain fusion protein [Calditrichota bacterium]
MINEKNEKSTNFIKAIIDKDIESNKYNNRVHTRFPPEPNGYLHIGHAKSICLNFGIAESYPGGKCNLRFDDTNPVKEEEEYVNSIINDIKWLGFDWEDRLFFASDYFQQMYEYALELIKKNKAFVDDSSAEEIRLSRGTLTKPGIESPYRNRTVVENLDLFKKMKKGEFPDGSKVLRAKIDMASGNINMRDPVMYRILHASHHRTGNKWCIYPTYDWAHGLEDSIESITHSICTLEFEDHRPLYDWFLDQLGIYHPQQIEFARLNLNYTIMSKRKLLRLVTEKYVNGWDDPRMPTLAGFRRKGFTPESIRDFAERIGVAKSDNVVDYALLEHCLREDLNTRALRAMVVLNPLKVIIENYPEDKVEEMEAENNPEDQNAGKRIIHFSNEIYIEREDFITDPPKKWFRLSPGMEVRLKHGYYITCTNVIYDKSSGEIKELRCKYDPNSKGGWTDDGRKVKGTLHWVSAKHAIDAEIRLYDHLFLKENPEDASEGKDFIENLNPDSLQILKNAKAEPSLINAKPGQNCQFLRQGYFVADLKDFSKEKLVFNRTTGLRDTWARIVRSQDV